MTGGGILSPFRKFRWYDKTHSRQRENVRSIWTTIGIARSDRQCRYTGYVEVLGTVGYSNRHCGTYTAGVAGSDRHCGMHTANVARGNKHFEGSYRHEYLEECGRHRKLTSAMGCAILDSKDNTESHSLIKFLPFLTIKPSSYIESRNPKLRMSSRTSEDKPSRNTELRHETKRPRVGLRILEATPEIVYSEDSDLYF